MRRPAPRRAAAPRPAARCRTAGKHEPGVRSDATPLALLSGPLAAAGCAATNSARSERASERCVSGMPDHVGVSKARAAPAHRGRRRCAASVCAVASSRPCDVADAPGARTPRAATRASRAADPIHWGGGLVHGRPSAARDGRDGLLGCWQVDAAQSDPERGARQEAARHRERAGRGGDRPRAAPAGRRGGDRRAQERLPLLHGAAGPAEGAEGAAPEGGGSRRRAHRDHRCRAPRPCGADPAVGRRPQGPAAPRRADHAGRLQARAPPARALAPGWECVCWRCLCWRCV